MCRISDAHTKYCKNTLQNILIELAYIDVGIYRTHNGINAGSVSLLYTIKVNCINNLHQWTILSFQLRYNLPPSLPPNYHFVLQNLRAGAQPPLRMHFLLDYEMTNCTLISSPLK